MNDKEGIIGFLQETIDNLKGNKIPDMEVKFHGTAPGPDNPKATVILRIICRDVKPSNEDAVGIAIVACDCKDPSTCLLCNGHGWNIRDKFESGAVDYTLDIANG